MRIYQCLECRAVDSVPYASSADNRIVYCICRTCGEPMIVGNCYDDDKLKADESDIWFGTEKERLAQKEIQDAVQAFLETCEELVDVIDNIADGNRRWTDLDSFTTQPAHRAIAHLTHLFNIPLEKFAV